LSGNTAFTSNTVLLGKACKSHNLLGELKAKNLLNITATRDNSSV